MSSNEQVFTKENLDKYLKELAKEYKKLNGMNMPAEIILVGGAAILAGYGFRYMTTDIDAVIHAASSMKDAINHVGDKYQLPNGWINSDFVKTSSYTSKLSEISRYYASFSKVLEVRIIGAEYLIAMKLKAGREFKNDLSDVIGILLEHQKRGTDITLNQVKNAAKKLYGSWDDFPDLSKSFIENVFASGDYEELYRQTVDSESQSKDTLLNFGQNYPNVLSEGNVNDILKALKERKNRKQKE